MSITFTPRKLAKYIAKLDKTTINEATGLTEYEAFALKDTLDRAHRGHTYVTDQDRYAVPDLWRADLVGDCEDFALWIRHELQCQYGFSHDLP